MKCSIIVPGMWRGIIRSVGVGMGSSGGNGGKGEDSERVGFVTWRWERIVVGFRKEKRVAGCFED